jgi:hypothetical protein
VVKLADGQIILVPTTAVQQNENGISKIIKAPSPPKAQPANPPISPQERRLRPIAPAPIASIQTSSELLNSLLAQQQQQQQLLLQQQLEAIVRSEESSEPVITDTNSVKVEPARMITQKTKNIRKTIPIPSVSDERKVKIDPEEVIRYDSIILRCSISTHSFCFFSEREFAKLSFVRLYSKSNVNKLKNP